MATATATAKPVGSTQNIPRGKWSSCTVRKTDVFARWQPGTADVAAAMTHVRGGACIAFGDESCKADIDPNRLDDAVAACSASAPDPNVNVTVDLSAMTTSGLPCQSLSECRIEIRGIEWNSRHWIAVSSTPVADYQLDVFEVTPSGVVPYYTGGAPYVDAVCGEPPALGATSASMSTTMKIDWWTMPPEVRRVICYGAYAGD